MSTNLDSNSMAWDVQSDRPVRERLFGDEDLEEHSKMVAFENRDGKEDQIGCHSKNPFS